MANTLGDYLRSAVRYFGIGAGAVGAIGLEPALSTTMHPEIKPSSGIEQRLKEAPKPSKKIRYPGGIAYAQGPNAGNASPAIVERVSISEYYKRAVASDDIAPGARIGNYREPPIRATGFGFIENEWSTF